MCVGLLHVIIPRMKPAATVASPLRARRTTYSLLATSGEPDGYSQIGRLYEFACAFPGEDVIVDCGSIRWLDAHLAAGYAAIAGMLQKTCNTTIQFVNMIESVQNILTAHGLFGLRTARRPRSVIPMRRFDPGDAKSFAGYTQGYLTGQPMPQMSQRLAEKFFEGIDELYSNAELHSKTQHGIFACGQFFPKKQKIDFTIVDLGIGFHGSLAASLGINLQPHEAIAWGMRGRNTTRSGDIPGGLGLKILQEFVRLNGGRLCVVSHGGHWSLASSQSGRGGIMPNAFPGTAVTLEINTNDTHSYSMRDEV